VPGAGYGEKRLSVQEMQDEAADRAYDQLA